MTSPSLAAYRTTYLGSPSHTHAALRARSLWQALAPESPGATAGTLPAKPWTGFPTASVQNHAASGAGAGAPLAAIAAARLTTPGAGASAGSASGAADGRAAPAGA